MEADEKHQNILMKVADLIAEPQDNIVEIIGSYTYTVR